VRQFIYDHAANTRADLAAVGKDAVSRHTHWRLAADHPDAVPDLASTGDNPDLVPVLISPAAVQVMVAGADNAGVSAVIETFGPRGGPPSIARVGDIDG
jgi:hypothetical protein